MHHHYRSHKSIKDVAKIICLFWVNCFFLQEYKIKCSLKTTLLPYLIKQVLRNPLDPALSSSSLKLIIKKKNYASFLWMAFNFLKATRDPLWRGSLFTTKFLESPGTNLINLRRMIGWVEHGATLWFWTWDPWIGSPAP